MRVPYEDLPPLDGRRHDRSFRWLEDCPEVYGLQYGLDEARPGEKKLQKRLKELVRAAKDEGLVVPASFVHLMSRPDLYGRIPTSTACYVELPTRLVEVEGPAGRLLRFMNDQQCVFVWCLHLTPGGGHEVVAARPRFDDDLKGETLEDVARLVDPVVCADGFEEFIHRFWLENVLWDLKQRPRVPTAEEAAYLAHARAKRSA